jgi:hypothetical protein
MENLTNSVIDEKRFELDNDAVNHLAETRKWTKFISVLGFVFMGLMFIVVLILALIGGSNINGGFSALTLLPLLLVCSIYFFPIYYLFQFSSYSGQALNTKDNGLLSKALRYLKMHYRFMGILVIIMVSLYTMVILIMIVTGSFFNFFHS